MNSKKQLMLNPLDRCCLLDDMTPKLLGQSTTLYHRLIAAPALLQVSGLVIQASVWIPRSIHCL